MVPLLFVFSVSNGDNNLYLASDKGTRIVQWDTNVKVLWNLSNVMHIWITVTILITYAFSGQKLSFPPPFPDKAHNLQPSYASSCNYSTCVVLPVLLCTVLCCPLDYVQLEGRGYSSQSPSEPELNERNPNHTKTNLTYLRGTYSTKNWGCPKPLSLTSQKQESSWGENERDPRGY